MPLTDNPFCDDSDCESGFAAEHVFHGRVLCVRCAPPGAARLAPWPRTCRVCGAAHHRPEEAKRGIRERAWGAESAFYCTNCGDTAPPL